MIQLFTDEDSLNKGKNGGNEKVLSYSRKG